MVALDILSDGFFAAIAGIGFGAISDPPLRAFKMIAILAALGHACRFCLMTYLGVDIATAFFIWWFGNRFRQIMAGKESLLSDDSTLYSGIASDDSRKVCLQYGFSLIMCLQTVNKPEMHDKYIEMQEMFFSNSLVASTVIFMLAVGATFPMFIFPRRAFSLTRH